MNREMYFLLNDREVCSTDSPGLLVLDYLRNIARLTGTKEGCKEGDCGACSVLLGELEKDKMRYRVMTSCLIPMGEIHGKHLVTIEGLNMPNLSPIQEAICEEGGSQCGFCTPGIVVSLTGYIMEHGADVDDRGIKVALSGNLCRCTGYSSLKRAGASLVEMLKKWQASDARLRSGDNIEALIDHRVIPEYFCKIPDRLRKLERTVAKEVTQPPQFIIAGGTDIYVQRGESIPYSRVEILNLYPQMKKIIRGNDTIRVGALTTFEEFAAHPEIVAAIPKIGEYMNSVASLHIRNRATLGGNIVNASPIADMAILLLALEATLVLKEDDVERMLPLSDFFKGYKQLAKNQGELVTEIVFQLPTTQSKINFEKVSKRKCLDIASVNSAIQIRCDDGGIIRHIMLSMGGVAPIPFLMRRTCSYLLEKPLCCDTIADAFPIAQNEIAPISDVRGSAEYKRLLVRQLMIVHFSKLFPQYIRVQDFYKHGIFNLTSIRN